ncbi:MAG: hypothetical protein Kow0075_17220 [Salibacteraceae bacterium]
MWSRYAIVDDSKFDRLVCGRIIEHLDPGAPLVEFQTGLEAYEYFLNGGYRGESMLILLDLNMPEMGGLEFLQKIHTNKKLKNLLGELNVIIITSSTLVEDKLEALGYDCVLGIAEKPTKLGTIKRLFEKKKNGT